MLVIRLQRTGRTNLATYRIVVAEKSRAVKGKFQEIVGHYLPAQKNPVFKFDAERIGHWVSKGAIPSETVARMLKREGMKDMDKFITRYAKRRSKKAPPEEAAQAPVAAATEPAASVDTPEAAPAEKVAETPVADTAPEAASEAPVPAETKEEAAPEKKPAEEAAPAAEATEGDKAAK